MTHEQDMKKLKVKLKEAYDRGYKDGKRLALEFMTHHFKQVKYEEENPRFIN